MTRLFRILFSIAYLLAGNFSYAATLFVLHSVGETNALVPVINQLPKGSYKILAFGPAFSKLKNNPSTIHILAKYQRKGVKETINEEDLQQLKSLLGTPYVLVTGMASTVQAQIVNAFGEKTKKVIFYDNFDPLWTTTQGIKEYIRPFYEALASGQPYHLIIPGTSYLESARHLDKFSSAIMAPLGQPSLEEWDAIYEKTDPIKLRKELNIPENHKVILYAGGFDPVDRDQYEENFIHFLKGATSFEGVSILVTYHPKTQGAIERMLVKSYGGSATRIIEKERGYSTAQLSTIADVVVCFKSTVGAQAAYMGKPVLYVAKKYENFLTKAGLALLETNSEGVRAAISTIFAEKGRMKFSFAETLGVPKEASKEIAKLLQNL